MYLEKTQYAIEVSEAFTRNYFSNDYNAYFFSYEEEYLPL